MMVSIDSPVARLSAAEIDRHGDRKSPICRDRITALGEPLRSAFYRLSIDKNCCQA
jgi:hypothetical protein